MITIEFEVNEEELAENLTSDIPATHYPLFVLSYFMMPVRMKFNDFDLLTCNEDPWAEMPIIYIASNGLIHIKNLANTHKEVWELPEAIGVFEFNLTDNIVHVTFDNLSKPFDFIVNYNHLLQVFQNFTREVRAFIWERVPQLDDHPYWSPWLREERD